MEEINVAIHLEHYRDELNSGNHFIWEKVAAEICKKVKPDTKIIVGGPHATNWVEFVFNRRILIFAYQVKGRNQY